MEALSNPHKFNLFLKVEFSNEEKRGLLLCSKVITNLSTGSLFGKKEEYMVILNDFLEANQEKLKAFIMSISSEISVILILIIDQRDLQIIV